MRNLTGSGYGSLAQTPPDGDFARYVDELVAQQSRALSGGQKMMPVPGKAAPAKSNAPATRAQTRAAELRQPQPAAQTVRGSQKAQPGARSILLESWEDSQPKSDRATAAPMPGKGLKLPPRWLFIVLAAVAVAIFFFGGNGIVPIFILVWWFVLPPLLRAVIGVLKGDKSAQEPRRK